MNRGIEGTRDALWSRSLAISRGEEGVPVDFEVEVGGQMCFLHCEAYDGQIRHHFHVSGDNRELHECARDLLEGRQIIVALPDGRRLLWTCDSTPVLARSREGAPGTARPPMRTLAINPPAPLHSR